MIRTPQALSRPGRQKKRGFTGIQLHSRLLALLLTVLISCSGVAPEKDPLEAIRTSGELIILTRNAPTTYYQGREELEGFEYELASSFAHWLGVKPVFKVMDSTSEILGAIAQNQGHLAAAGLTRTPGRDQVHTFGPVYDSVGQMVICRRKPNMPNSIAELEDLSLMVVGDSSYEEKLTRLKQEHPKLHWTTTYEFDTEQVLEMVWEGKIDCTLANSHVFSINRRYFPELEIAFPFSEKEDMAWVIAPEYHDLGPLLDQWLLELDLSWELDLIKDRYFGYIRIFDYVDNKRFVRRIRERLPVYQADFIEAAQDYQFPWTLLAAQAYQESQWVATARSPTGVRGLMMLTQRTAGQLGVLDRLDPRESILGGAKYLSQLYQRLPDSVQGQDRIWIALACYNVGYAHVMDACQLAEEKGLDPNLWQSLREVLPLLSQREYYRRLNSGYARGREPVRYVQRIRNYRDILERFLAAEAVLSHGQNLIPALEQDP